MSYKVLDLSELNLWEELLNALPDSQRDVYFTPEYYSLYQNYGCDIARCFVYEMNGDRVLYPFLMNPITPLGYMLDKEYYDIQGAYGYNGIIASNHSSAFITSFWDLFDRWCQDNDVLAEFTRFHPLMNNQRLASLQMKIIHSRRTVALDLTDDNIWMHQISSKNRNMIRKAEKEGIVIVESEDYGTFRQLYDGTMSDLHAESFYYFPQSYYEEYKNSFNGKSLLCLAMLDGKAIAGSMFMFSDYYAHYHLSARDREFSRYPANNLILWYGIQRAKELGCKLFHFGGGTTSDEGDSLLRFKKEFSNTLCDFYIGKRVHNQEMYDKVVEQWKTNYPDSYEHNQFKLLGYREI